VSWRDGSWDVVYLDDVRLPGRVVALDVSPERDVQKSQTPGTDGPDLKDQGYKGATVALTLEMFRASQADELLEMIGAISPRQLGAFATPHTIRHPLTVAANVTRVYVEGYTIGMPVAGRMPVSLKLQEWFPPKPKPKTKQKAKPKTTGIGDGGPFATGGVPAPNPANLGASFP
jgi:hypothetical protein